MAEIRIERNESLDSALRRFKSKCQRAGILSELKKRKHYEKPSEKRRKKEDKSKRLKARTGKF
ncbi:30S ribosomal protein S21 [bacterium]|nr:30S ribosomal protein S21 [bacterium]